MFAGNYYDGISSRATPVTCEPAPDGSLAIRGGDLALQFARGGIEVSPRLARTFRTLRLPNGAQIHSEDNDGVDAAFPDRNRIESVADRLERYPYVVAVSVLVILAAAVTLFHIGVPWAAERVAARVPASVDKAMGDEVLATLTRYVLQPSKLDIDEQHHLQQSFAEFAKGSPDSETFSIVFYRAPGIGANAFALPGGTIVVTDELVELIGNDANNEDEFLAVAAHEAGHQHYRHVLRSVLQGSVIAIIAANFAGDVSSASTVVVAVPTFLLQSSYSRDFEAQADDYAFDRLAAHNISPRAFADVMRKLSKQYPDEDDLAYLSSHPLNAERIARAEAAADAFEKKNGAVSPAPVRAPE
jgi:predicted Zn-dependent protease